MFSIYYLLPPGISYHQVPLECEFEALYPPEPNAVLEHQRLWRIVTLRPMMRMLPKVDKEPCRYYLHVSTRVVSEVETMQIIEGLAA